MTTPVHSEYRELHDLETIREGHCMRWIGVGGDSSGWTRISPTSVFIGKTVRAARRWSTLNTLTFGVKSSEKADPVSLWPDEIVNFQGNFRTLDRNEIITTAHYIRFDRGWVQLSPKSYFIGLMVRYAQHMERPREVTFGERVVGNCFTSGQSVDPPASILLED